ncbi:hypothetical protein UFOVP1290_406 [uncultured Caudovirales phage]|uniref:Uncharacterized protein n=1 Tax=uncultured Caudovirales phage TaxID=2100421 RepID=A0A6J5RRK1_9CAUD|nr:hypothetical protein UFOVP1290_406 [uncultured Caudovirales phage]
MKKVEIYSNWCYLDILGEDYSDVLTDGEELKILWNDGTITKEKIIVESRTDHYTGHGGGDDITTSKAYIKITYMGVPAMIRLADTDLLCERIKIK